MGHGKGNVEEWVAVVKMGRMLYEMEGVTPEIAKEAMALASHKLPLTTRIVSRSSATRPTRRTSPSTFRAGAPPPTRPPARSMR